MIVSPISQVRKLGLKGISLLQLLSGSYSALLPTFGGRWAEPESQEKRCPERPLEPVPLQKAVPTGACRWLPASGNRGWDPAAREALPAP